MRRTDIAGANSLCTPPLPLEIPVEVSDGSLVKAESFRADQPVPKLCKISTSRKWRTGERFIYAMERQ